VEFIADASDGLRPDRFWFMEMNTRLQVEHPVTEAVTGSTSWNGSSASPRGAPAAQQEDLSPPQGMREARLYAEDPAAGFLPATGLLSRLSLSRTCLETRGKGGRRRQPPGIDP
jgi:3-methylcrotonyl-CoA carboxylase alpha subunit